MINSKLDDLIIMFGDSLHDVSQFLKETPRLWDRNYQSISNAATMDWSLGVNWEQALQMAETGWTEGALSMADKLAVIPPNEAEPEYTYDVAGYMPDVPLYCSGEPMHMMNHGHPEGRKPVIHIVINAIASGFVKAQHYANYGAAMTAMVQQIEATGRQVELDIVFVDSLRYNKAILGWKVKRAGENLDMSAIAYSIGHPAAFRRIGFAMIERTPANNQCIGYGHCASLTEKLAEHINAKGAFLLGGIGENPRACDTMASTMKFAAQQINKAAGETLVEVRD